MDWRIKALAFRLLGAPGGTSAHYFLQRHVTKSWPRSQGILSELEMVGTGIIKDYQKFRGGMPNSVMEIGAGRDLAVPLSLRKLGVERVFASDITRLARLDLINSAAKILLDSSIEFKTWEELERFGISYLAPHYVDTFSDNVDCSCSNEVLEHIPVDQLRHVLTGLRSITKGISTHLIDYSDHYARTDSATSRLNFLKYSEEKWRRYNSGMQYVNRLRHSDYIRMFQEAGFKILDESSVAGEPSNEVIDNIAPMFHKYDRFDLFAIRGRIIAE